MYDLRFQPKYLPQIKLPHEVVMEKLSTDGIDSELVYLNPNEVEPIQGFTFNDKVYNEYDPNDAEPAWVSNNDRILDGHHKFVSALKSKKPFKCVKIDLDEKNAIRVLNRIQDIYEYEEQLNMEEVVSQDIINMENEIDSGIEEDFLKMLDEANIENESGTTEGNQQTIMAYRKGPIKEESIIGNFFIVEPIEGYEKYEIDFDNLLDTNDLGIEYKSGQVPTDVLARNWFPNINFERLSKPFGIPVNNLKNKAIAEKARKMGYDGIKYGDIMIQGLK
ncbi:MAG: hypothetical protein ACOC33_03890 [bacterium]